MPRPVARKGRLCAEPRVLGVTMCPRPLRACRPVGYGRTCGGCFCHYADFTPRPGMPLSVQDAPSAAVYSHPSAPDTLAFGSGPENDCFIDRCGLCRSLHGRERLPSAMRGPVLQRSQPFAAGRQAGERASSPARRAHGGPSPAEARGRLAGGQGTWCTCQLHRTVEDRWDRWLVPTAETCQRFSKGKPSQPGSLKPPAMQGNECQRCDSLGRQLAPMA